MASLFNLPDEIINIIIAILFDEARFVRNEVTRNLALANRRLYELVLPYHYRQTSISVNAIYLERLNSLLRKQPWKGEFMRELEISFGISIPGSYLIQAGVQFEGNWKTWKVDLAEELQKTLFFAKNLRALKVTLQRSIYDDDDFAAMPWRLDLSCCTYLERLDLLGFYFTPSIINTLSTHRSIRVFNISDRVDEGSWNVIPVMHKSSITNLSIMPQNGVLMWTLESMLPNFGCLVKLSITLGKDMLVGRALRSTLEHLSKRETLQSLCLETPHLAKNMDYDLDFSTFPVLNELVIDSMMIWPYIDGFERRSDLYERLPQTLRRLTIYFPYSIEDPNGNVDNLIDGIVQKNSPTEFIYVNPYVPSERYIWIENLLKSVPGPDSVEKAYLPALKHIEFAEEKYYPRGWYGEDEPIYFDLHLPKQLADKFRARGITTQLTQRGSVEDMIDEDSSDANMSDASSGHHISEH